MSDPAIGREDWRVVALARALVHSRQRLYVVDLKNEHVIRLKFSF